MEGGDEQDQRDENRRGDFELGSLLSDGLRQDFHGLVPFFGW
ncbi:hypothetical protein QFZ72_005435 [Bacillus sp. V2I10]|nr:hypothetical protein [Bacillus sp. V2I10]